MTAPRLAASLLPSPPKGSAVRHGASGRRGLAKARTAAECEALEQLPNIGPSLAADLRALGIAHPRELATHDPFVLYQALCTRTRRRQDPCVLDTFMAITDFMRGAAAAPWWAYTAQRKRLFGRV
jgi:hypothetical protein